MKKIKSERGQSLVELAISIVILIYLLAGAVEFGIVFFQFVQLRDAAQEGALYGSMHPDDTVGIETRAKNASSSPIDLAGDPDVDVIVAVTGPSCEGSALAVTVRYPHQVFMPFMSQFIGQTVSLDAVVTDTILTPVCP